MELAPQDPGAILGRGYTKFGAGDFAGAAADFGRSLELKDNIYAMLFRYIARKRSGERIAPLELDTNSLRLKDKEWPYPIIELYLGRRLRETVLEAASKPAQQCEAQFYVAEWLVMRSDAAAAVPLLRGATGICPATYVEYSAASAELKRMGR